MNEKTAITVEGYTKDEVTLIKNTVAKNTTDIELAFFLSNAKAQNLNPLLKEIWCYKDRRGNLIMFAGRDGFLTIAQRDKKYKGIRSCAVCENDEFKIDVANNKIEHTFGQGARGKYIGAYAICFAEGREPVVEWADIDIYDKHQFTWDSHKAEMIKKCFDDKTKILTPDGFKYFKELGKDDLVAQVRDNLTFEFVKPKRIIVNIENNYKMIKNSNTKIDMCIMETHRMSTIHNNRIEEIEAKKVYAKLRERKPVIIPRCCNYLDKESLNYSDDELRLIGYFLADGYLRSPHTFGINISKERKIESIEKLGLHFTKKHIKGTKIRGKIANDQSKFLFKNEKILNLFEANKNIILEKFHFSSRQFKIIIDSWCEFDGSEYYKQKGIYTSNPNHKRMIEVIGIMAGYSTKNVYKRKSDLSHKFNYFIALNENKRIKARKATFEKINYFGKTYCVEVPTGRIIVQRDGYSIISGNCAEIHALKKQFGIHSIYGLEEKDSMMTASEDSEEAKVIMKKISDSKTNEELEKTGKELRKLIDEKKVSKKQIEKARELYSKRLTELQSKDDIEKKKKEVEPKEKHNVEIEIKKLEKEIKYEEAQYRIDEENPTDTKQFQNAHQKHYDKIDVMKIDLSILKDNQNR